MEIKVPKATRSLSYCMCVLKWRIKIHICTMERLKELPWKSITAQYFFRGGIREMCVSLPTRKNSRPQKNWDTGPETQRISLKIRKSIRTFHLDRFEISIITAVLAKWTFPEEKLFTTGPIPILISVWFSLKCWSWWKVTLVMPGADVFVTSSPSISNDFTGRAVTHTKAQCNSPHSWWAVTCS